MPQPLILLTAEEPRGLDGLPWWLITIVFAFILGTYWWNSNRRRDAARRHMTRDDWEAELRANDPDMKSDD